MLESSQALLIATTVLILFAFVGYVSAAVFARRESKERTRAMAGAGALAAGWVEEPERDEPAAPKQGKLLSGSSLLVKFALVALTASLIMRALSTGHAPFANHYEFAVSFAWGMILAQVLFDWRFKVRTLALAVLPVIFGMLVYATTLSYEASPLVPALQNSPLLTIHVFAAALAYGAAAVGFGAAVMYLLAPKVKWKGWPKRDILDEIGYASVVATFPLLTIMIVLGAIWANIAWGRYWSWDPKETAALVTWLVYGGYLHARVTAGWRGDRSAWLLVLGFAAILFTYFGNLFFGGMHAYA